MVLCVDIDAFAVAHQAEWNRLAHLVRRRRRLTGAEADELVSLYQQASTHLSQVRDSPGANPGTVARLATLVARARSAVTGAQVPSWQVVARFINQDFPAAAYRARRLGLVIMVLVSQIWRWRLVSAGGRGGVRHRVLPVGRGRRGRLRRRVRLSAAG